MTKEQEITIRMPEYSPEIVWRSGFMRGWYDGDPIPYKIDEARFPGSYFCAHASRVAAIKANEFWGDAGEPFSAPLEAVKEIGRQSGYDWLLVFDIDMEVLDAYQL